MYKNEREEPIRFHLQSYAPLAAGEKYIEAAKQILTINNNLQKEIDEINHEDHGCLKLGIP